MDRIFNANSNADAHQSQRVRVDLRDHNFDSLEENGRIDLTGISLMAVTDRFHKVEFRQAYIAAAPKQDDTKPYAEPVRFGEGKLNYRMPLTKAPTVQQPDYDINVADGETVRGEVDWTYTSKAGKALSVNVDGKPLAGGTGVPETPSFTMEDQGVTVGAFKGPAVLSGAGEDQPSYFTLSSPSTGWGKETVRLASQPAVDESGKTELLLASSDADGYFKLGSTAYGVVNHNDPHVRGIALTLPDGSVHTPIGINKYLFDAKGDVNYTIQHVAYGPQTSYALGDGYPAGSNPSIPPVIGFVFDLSNADLTPVIRTMRYHLDTMDLPDGKHTLELLEAGTVKKRLSFTVNNRAERQRESPVLSASDTRFNGAKARISLTATSPTGKDMDVSLFTNNPLQVTGTALDDNGTDALTSGQMQGLTTGGEPIASHSSTTVPEHQFTVSVGDDTTGDVALSWKGSTDDGERVRMSVRNPKTSQWDIVADGQGAMQASAVVNIGTYAVNGSIKVKVQPVYVTNGSDTMLWMSDTQHYAYFQKFVPYYMGITQYAADQYKDGKIGYAAVTGDLVEQNDGANWPVADKAFATMDKAGVPMGVVAGNHDVGNHTASTGYESGNYANFQKYFGAKRYEGKDWWGGSRNNNINHYDLVTIGGYDFVMLYLGMGHEASDETVQWAHDVLAQYPQRNAIVLTHEYLSYKGEPYVDTYGSGNIQVGKDIFEKIVKPNKNIVMVLCGHESGAVTNVKQVDGRTVVEMLANYQTIDLSHSQESTDNYWTSNGDEFLRLLTFKDGKVSFTTYSPLLDRYNAYAPQIDTGEEQLDLRAPSRNLVTEGFSAIRLDKSAVSSSPSSAKVQQTLHSGQSMTVDIDMGSDSGWYAVLDDGRNKTITVLRTNTKTGGGSEQPSGPNGSSGNGGSGVDGPADAGRPAETEKNSSAASQQRLGYLSVTGATTAWVVALLTVLVSVGWLILRRRRRMVD